MPYLRMFLGEQQLDEVFIPEVLLAGVTGIHIVEEEKQDILKRHANAIRKVETKPVFYLDAVPSATNYFTSLKSTKGDAL